MPTYRIDLAYDGSGFHGYARQPGVRTVQGELEEALFRLTGPVDTFVAGRTDRGVHASGQVVSFSVAEAVDPARVQQSLNRQLGPEIAVLGCSETSADFHARFSATSRRYEYRIVNRVAPDPFRAGTSWHIAEPLDVAAMNRAAACFVGEHDFAAFCRKAKGRSTVRRVLRAGWERRSDVVAFEVEASAFCHQMVRSLVALCVAVGRGRVAAAEVPDILRSADRNAAEGAAPPNGLTLVAVGYANRTRRGIPPGLPPSIEGDDNAPMTLAEAAQRWAETWQRAWEALDSESIVALYGVDALLSTEPFREPYQGRAGVRSYVARVFGEEENPQVHVGVPIVDGERAAVTWWASLGESGTDVSLAGTSVLRFDADGLVAEQWDSFNLARGRRRPPSNWGPFAVPIP